MSASLPRSARPRSLAVTIALVLLVIAPLALAKKPAPKKKGTKPTPSASATATTDAAPEAAPEPTPAPAPAPAANDSAAGVKGTATVGASASTEGGGKEKESADTASSEGKASASDVLEDPKHTYYFGGLRYRHTILPTFMLHLFINEGATIHQNSIGFELDIRKESKSLIPWIAYQEYGTGDMLFFQKGQPDAPNNYSVVNSSLKALYLGLDELWSVPITPQLQFEYGFGVGLGFLFGSLQNDWVYLKNPSTPGANDGGPFVASNGNSYAVCQSEIQPGDATGSCQRSAHSGASTAKVHGYTEGNWFNGGSIPVIFPHVSIPQIGLRFHPTKEIAARLGAGFSLTGFWVGLSANYDVEPLFTGDKTDKGEKKEESPDSEHKTSLRMRRRDTL
jgi:hypothetical protein